MKSHHASGTGGVFWDRVTAILLTLCLMNKSGSAISFEGFVGYPFDETNGYSVFPRELNQVRGLPIPVPFPYFGRTFSYAHIDDSGYISLVDTNLSDISSRLSTTPYTPKDFPLNSSNTIISGVDWSAVVAPYWYDVDTRGNGSGLIYYKNVTRSTDSALINEIDSFATSHLFGFNTIWALIVTWDEVGYYESQHGDPNNTFQVVIATNGQRSIAVFNYAENGINWPGDSDGRALAGYNVGDNIRHFKLPGSLSEDIQYIDNTTGNTGREGQWVFLLGAPQVPRYNDTIIGDPLYEVQVITDVDGREISLCYEVHGGPNRNFNLISDTCVSVNALYSPMINASNGNIISKIGVLAEDLNGTCQEIEADLVGCTARVGGQVLTTYNQDGVSVMCRTDRVRIAVPNCDDVDLVMWVVCEGHREQPMIRFVVARGFNLRSTSHGLIGQFWNVKVEAERYNVTAEDKIPPGPNHYAVTVRAPDGTTRRFFGWKSTRTWDRKSQTCLYSGDAQGGLLYEVTSLSDPVIQGTYDEYAVSGLFDPEYKYEMFDSQCS